MLANPKIDVPPPPSDTDPSWEVLATTEAASSLDCLGTSADSGQGIRIVSAAVLHNFLPSLVVRVPHIQHDASTFPRLDRNTSHGRGRRALRSSLTSGNARHMRRCGQLHCVRDIVRVRPATIPSQEYNCARQGGDRTQINARTYSVGRCN